MKTLPIVTFLAALAAAILLPISLELAGSLLVASGFASILLADYAAPKTGRLLSATLAARPARTALRLAA